MAVNPVRKDSGFNPLRDLSLNGIGPTALYSSPPFQGGTGFSNGAKIKPAIRRLKDLKQVIYDKNWLNKARDFPVYYMYRGVKEENGLRYDITVIPPKMLGEEFTKTQGHHHRGKYGELYTILQGEAIYLMQRFENKKITDVFVVRAKKGESVVIPSGYAHITINPTRKVLKMANWISEKCQSVYGLIGKKRGACYFYTKKGWIKNKNYGNVPSLRFKKPLKTVPKDLSFLKGLMGAGGEIGKHVRFRAVCRKA